VNPDNIIKEVIEEGLKNQKTSVDFDEIWKDDIMKNNKNKTSKKLMIIAIVIISIILLSVVGTFAAPDIFRNVDNVDYKFIDDPYITGKWKAVDFVEEIDYFKPGTKNNEIELYITELVFIKKGKMLASMDSGNLAYTTLSWTKGFILNKQEQTASEYIIKEIEGKTYLFFEWKSGDYIYDDMKPWYYVLENVDREDYSKYKVKRIRRDNIDYDFVDDHELRGKWESVDFVRSMNVFDAKNKNWRGSLYLKGLNFKEEGQIIFTTKKGDIIYLQFQSSIL
jgi:hypothetical protein